MAKHRLERPAPIRPRLGRIAAAATSLVVTSIALLGGVGVIPLGTAGTAATNPDTPSALGAPANPSPVTAAQPEKKPAKPVAQQKADPTALPAESGTGKRVVFSMSQQRVWLVGEKGNVLRSYLVSGSTLDNLKPGSYEVFSRSRYAVGINDSGTMEYFVRFTRGANAAIGFHSIPEKNGKPLQTEAELGTPQSHGCIRASLDDAKRLWAFAPTGTDVVVVA